MRGTTCMTTDEKFDAITSDPLDPWVKGAAMLYSREFFETVKKRLNPGGVVTLFVQLYESNTEAVKSEVATFLEAFPNGMIFGNTNNGQGYDMVLLGQVEPTVINLDEIQAKLARPEYQPIAQSLAEIGMYIVVDLFATFAGNSTAAALAGRRDHQSRPQPEAAVSRGPRRPPLSERRDLRADAAPCRLSAGNVHRLGGDAVRPAAGDATAARAIDTWSRATCDGLDVLTVRLRATCHVPSCCGSANYGDHTEASVPDHSQG